MEELPHAPIIEEPCCPHFPYRNRLCHPQTVSQTKPILPEVVSVRAERNVIDTDAKKNEVKQISLEKVSNARA